MFILFAYAVVTSNFIMNIPHSLVYLQPLITLDGSITFTFSTEGMNMITVQVLAGNAILQDTKTIAVYGEPFDCYLFYPPTSLETSLSFPLSSEKRKFIDY